jgi:hypothetical protein
MFSFYSALVLIRPHQALAHMSNGVLRDTRVFHVDSPDWTEKYNHQSIVSLMFHDFELTLAL